MSKDRPFIGCGWEELRDLVDAASFEFRQKLEPVHAELIHHTKGKSAQRLKVKVERYLKALSEAD